MKVVVFMTNIVVFKTNKEKIKIKKNLLKNNFSPVFLIN